MKALHEKLEVIAENIHKAQAIAKELEEEHDRFKDALHAIAKAAKPKSGFDNHASKLAALARKALKQE